MYSYSNKIRFIGIILFSFLYRTISVDSMRSVFLYFAYIAINVRNFNSKADFRENATSLNIKH
jgi:hypothetical protein